MKTEKQLKRIEKKKEKQLEGLMKLPTEEDLSHLNSMSYNKYKVTKPKDI